MVAADAGTEISMLNLSRIWDGGCGLDKPDNGQVHKA
jgi:hypothetical protein